MVKSEGVLDDYPILHRRISDEDNERLFHIKGQLTSAFLSLPNTKVSAGKKAASKTSRAGATAMTPFRGMKEGRKSEAKRLNPEEVQNREAEVRSREEGANKEGVRRPEKACLSSEHFEAGIRHAEASIKMPEEPLIILETSRQQDKQSDTSRHQTEPTNRASPEIQDVVKQLREKERHLQIREAEVQDVEKVLRVKERDLRIREAEVQKMLQAENERREAMGFQEDNVRQRLAAMKWEENPRPREAPLTQQMAITRQPNSTARESDLLSLSSILTIRNSPHVRNVDLSPESSAGLKRDSWDHGSELASLASTTSSSSKSCAGLKEDSEYYSNE